MADEGQLTFQQQCLVQQGYRQFTARQLREMEWGLRFTPFVCALLALYGLATRQPWVLFTVSGLGVWAFLFPAAHPMDLFYNKVLRPLLGAAPIPPNPLQRRLACLSAAIMNALAGTLFLLGLPRAALVAGSLLLILQAIVIVTHFCALSWMYEGVARMLGNWNRPVEPDVAQRLLRAGAAVIDVRTPQEYAERHLTCALNHPLESLTDNLDKLPAGVLLLHCKSGMRSNMAIQLLKKHGFRNVHNLGSFERAERVVGG
jgi:rhodanese-related sulfurtransferase